MLTTTAVLPRSHRLAAIRSQPSVPLPLRMKGCADVEPCTARRAFRAEPISLMNTADVCPGLHSTEGEGGRDEREEGQRSASTGGDRSTDEGSPSLLRTSWLYSVGPGIIRIVRLGDDMAAGLTRDEEVSGRLMMRGG